MPKKRGQFVALIEGDADKREVSRCFPAGDRPSVILGTAKGCIRVTAWEDDAGEVMVDIERGRWALGDGEPVNGPANGQTACIYRGPMDAIEAEDYAPLLKTNGQGGDL